MYQKLLCQFYPSQTLKVTKSAAGYGMAMLLVFLSSSILIASSTSLLLAPGSSSYMGMLSLDQSTANQLAEVALDAAQTDILTQQAAGTTITTAYRYPSSGSNTIYAPTYPGSGATVAKGSYYVTTTYARGYTFLLKANVTVGANNVAVSRLVQLNHAPPIITYAYAIYSLRKVNPNYSGNAVNVRRSSDSATQNIGFDSSGNFNTSAYSAFVGGGTGYVTTWYDQSGNGNDLTQASTTAQPIIDTTGTKPAIFIDITGCSGSASNCDYLEKTGLSLTLTPMTMTAFGVGRISVGASNSYAGRFLSLYKTGTSDSSNANSVGAIMKQSDGSAGYIGSRKSSNEDLRIALSYGQDFQVTSIADGTNRSFRKYQASSGLLTSTTTANASESLALNKIRVGINDGLNSNAGWDGRVSEIILFTTALSSSEYSTIEADEKSYFGL